MMSRLRGQLFYAGLAAIFIACYAALGVIGMGRAFRRKAGIRVERARRRVMRAGASFVRRLRSAT